MSRRRWPKPGIPRSGWVCVAAEDTADPPYFRVPENYESCKLCGLRKIRYVYTMRHQATGETLRVGSTCAAQLDQSSRRREHIADPEAWATRRGRWTRRPWDKYPGFDPGIEWLCEDGHFILVFADALTGPEWRLSIDGSLSAELFPTRNSAKLAAFDRLFRTADKADKFLSMLNG
jgi:hypothetical protein